MADRPLSPHIQIYRPQITSVLSILHRFTGIGLFCGTILFCIGFVAFACGESTWKEFVTIWHALGGKFWQWCLIFSLHYHTFNGIRHLLWDFGYGYELNTVTRTGVLTLIFSLGATILFAHFCNII